MTPTFMRGLFQVVTYFFNYLLQILYFIFIKTNISAKFNAFIHDGNVSTIITLTMQVAEQRPQEYADDFFTYREHLILKLKKLPV